MSYNKSDLLQAIQKEWNLPEHSDFAAMFYWQIRRHRLRLTLEKVLNYLTRRRRAIEVSFEEVDSAPTPGTSILLLLPVGEVDFLRLSLNYESRLQDVINSFDLVVQLYDNQFEENTEQAGEKKIVSYSLENSLWLEQIAEETNLSSVSLGFLYVVRRGFNDYKAVYKPSRLFLPHGLGKRKLQQLLWPAISTELKLYPNQLTKYL